MIILLSKLQFFLNYTSGLICLGVLVLFGMELGFQFSVENRALLLDIHEMLFLYFIVDMCLRFVFRWGYRRFDFRLTDLVLFVPLYAHFFLELSFLGYFFLIQICTLVIVLGRLGHVGGLIEKLRLDPTQLFVLGFIFFVFIGSLLLSLPLATPTGVEIPYIDALFTAVSAVCVTGLVTLDIGTNYSLFGQIVILFLIQIGGLGIMAFSALFALFLRRKMSQKETTEFQESFASVDFTETLNIIKAIFKYTLVLECVGFGLLFVVWRDRFESVPELLFSSIFHSVSAFCNAGFSLFSHNLESFSHDGVTLIIIAILIILGGIGFPVMYNIMHPNHGKLRFYNLRLQTKVVLSVTIVLLLLGTGLIFLTEFNHALAGFSFLEKIYLSFFHSVSPRTAGFNAISLDRFHPATLLTFIALMFIGASPGSTGGGIKTTTFGILMIVFWNKFKGYDRSDIFHRTLTSENINKAIALIMFSIVLVLVFFFTMLLIESHGFVELLFETISAYATVGLSLGITGDLTVLGKIWVVFLMFMGRLGPLTIAFALSSRRQSQRLYSFPEETILIG